MRISKKISCMLLLGLMLISLASAMEIDNTYKYNEVTREATFYNTFLGFKTSQVGKARLDSSLNVNVAPGYRNVGNFTLWAYEDYNNALKPLKIKNMKTGKEEVREIDYVRIDGYKKEVVPDYKTVCSEVWSKENQTYSNQCDRVEDGQHTIQKPIYKKITPADLKKNEFVNVQVWTEVKVGDFHDWKPTIYGEDVPEWATWTASLSVLQVAYWKLDNNNFSDSYGPNNLTNVGSSNVTGKIIDGRDFDTTDRLYISNANKDNFDLATGDFAVSFWLNLDVAEDHKAVIGKGSALASPNAKGWYVQTRADGNIRLVVGTGTNLNYYAADLLTTGSYDHYVLIKNGSTGHIYKNGAEASSYTSTTSLAGAVDAPVDFQIGMRDHPGNVINGKLDEISVWNRTLSLDEVIQLYNGGAGLPFLPSIPDIDPIVILNSPVNNTNYTESPLIVNFSCYASDDINLSSVGLYIDGSLDQINATGLNNTNYTFSKSLTDEQYNWTCEGTDNASQTTKPTARNFGIHSIVPNVTLHYPTGIIDYHLGGDSLVLNWTVSEQGQNLTTHITNCTYEYNGVITEINNTVCTQVNETTFIPLQGVYNLTFTVTDEFDFVNTTVTTWSIRAFEINQTFDNQTTEGSTQNISALIKLQDGLTIATVILDYNGTLSAGTSSDSEDNILVLRSGLVTPNVEADENITFHWSIVLSGGETINLSEQNQTILNMGIDNCSVFTNTLFNLTIKDEEMQTIIPSGTDLEIAINIFSEDRSTEVIDFSDEFEGINPVAVCLNLNISEGASYSLDSIIRYQAIGYANEYYNIVDYTLDSDTETQNITLYDLNITDSTDFQLTFTGEDFLPVENALVFVARQYISENVFKTVEIPRTDANGQTILHLVRNDVIYNILVTKDAEVLGSFSNVIAFCEDFTIGACSLPLNALSNTSLVFNYDDEIGIIFQETTQFNETTRVASFEFSSVDGTPVVVGMSVERRDIFGNRTICENTVLSASGSVSCVVSEDVTDTSLYSIISVDGEDKIYSNVDLDKTGYGQNGYAMFFIMAIATALMFSGSKTWTLIGLSLNYISGVSLGVIIGGVAGKGTAGILILVISMLGIWQLNKERKQ